MNYSISIKNIGMGDDLGKYNTVTGGKILNYLYYKLCMYVCIYVSIYLQIIYIYIPL